MSTFFSAVSTIPWSQLKAEQALPELRALLKKANTNLERIEQLDVAKVSYKNTFAALEEATAELGRAWSLVNHLDGVCNSPQLREVIAQLLPEITDFFTGISLREQLWLRLKAAADSTDKQSLHPHQVRHLEETVADFLESGADLAEEQQQQLRQIEQELAQKTQTFSEQVLDATNAWELVITEKDRLTGLPESALQAAESAAKNQGIEGWKFTLHQPSLLPVLTYAKDASLRKQIWQAANAVGREAPYDNRDLVEEILTLRQQKAELLGYTNFADFVLSRRMAGSGAKAVEFVEDLRNQVRAQAEEETKELETFAAQSQGLTEVGALAPWDIAYWAEQLRLEKYEFDSEQLRPYLPMDSVMQGMFDLCEQLFGIRVVAKTGVYLDDNSKTVEENSLEVWHDQVTAYQLLDAESERVLGVFYADWHPREEKRGGAWMNPIHSNDPYGYNGEEIPHLGCICGNMTPPVEDRPALLLHEEVETIFHEFGHLLHHLLGNSPVSSLSGTSVPWDFVELPSQIMENWCWEKVSLDQFARHWQTNEPIPDEMLAKLRKTRNFRVATAFMRQLLFAKQDLDMHISLQHWVGKDLDEVTRTRLASYLLPTSIPAQSIAPRFTHLFGSSTGYAAGYYSYKWAEVLDADAFSLFLQQGLCDPELGRSFRKEILEQGNTRPVTESFAAFLGRDANPQALLARSGFQITAKE